MKGLQFKPGTVALGTGNLANVLVGLLLCLFPRTILGNIMIDIIYYSIETQEIIGRCTQWSILKLKRLIGAVKYLFKSFFGDFIYWSFQLKAIFITSLCYLIILLTKSI